MQNLNFFPRLLTFAPRNRYNVDHKKKTFISSCKKKIRISNVQGTDRIPEDQEIEIFIERFVESR
jgi:hypothetical protein